jgi:hypothetical protein
MAYAAFIAVDYFAKPIGKLIGKITTKNYYMVCTPKRSSNQSAPGATHR